MLNFKVNKTTLQPLLNLVLKAVAKKSDLTNPLGEATLVAVKAVADVTLLELSAYNGSFALSLNTDDLAVGAKEGSICLPAAYLAGVIGYLPDGAIEFQELANREVQITCGKTAVKLKGFDSALFPLLDRQFHPDFSTTLIPTQILKQAIRHVGFAADNEDKQNKNLRAASLEVRQKAASLATLDGFRLAYDQFPISRPQPDQAKPFGALLSAEAMRMLATVLSEQEYKLLEFSFNTKGNMLLFKAAGTERFHFMVALLDGNFPDYKKIIPKVSEFKTRVTVSREELLNATLLANLTLKNEFKGRGRFWLTFTHSDGDDKGGTLQLYAKSEAGEVQNDLTTYHVQGEANRICIDPIYLLDVMKHVDDSHFQLEVRTAEQPLIIRPALEESNFIYLILAMHDGQVPPVAPTKAKTKEKEEALEVFAVETQTLTSAEPDDTEEPLEAAQAVVSSPVVPNIEVAEFSDANTFVMEEDTLD